MQTQNIVSWYLVVVLSLLLVLQHLVMRNSQAEAIAKLEGRPAKTAVAPAAPAAQAAAANEPAKVAEKANDTSAEPEKKESSPLKALFAADEPTQAEKPKPVVPVKVAFRSEPFEKGKIVLVSNPTQKKRNYTITVTRPETGQRESFKVSLAPAAEARVDGTKDWAFRRGDHLEIAHAGFEPKSVEVP